MQDDLEKYYLSDKMLDYILNEWGSWNSNGVINPSIAHTIVSTMTKMHRAGVDNYVCKELPLDTPVEDIKRIMEESKCNVVGELDYATIEMHKRVYGTDGLSPSLSAGMGEGGGTIPKVLSEKKIGNLYGATGGNYAGNVYDDNYLAPSISTCGGGNQQPMVIAAEAFHPNTTVAIKQATDQGYIDCEYGGLADLSMPNSKTRRGRVQGGGNISPTLVSGSLDGIHRIESLYRIRKLTPRECWRLMAFTDEEFDKAAEVNSNTSLYKQAGNSIVVDVLSAIFQEIINADGTINDHKGEQINIFDILGE